MSGSTVDRVRGVTDGTQLRAALLGVVAILVAYGLGGFVVANTGGSVVDGFYTPVAATLFIGLAAGHYVGVALRRDGDELVTAAAAALVTLLALFAYDYRTTVLAYVVPGIAVVVLLTHDVGIVERRPAVGTAVTVTAGRIAPVALGVLGTLKYVVPFLRNMFPQSMASLAYGAVVVLLVAYLGYLKYQDVGEGSVGVSQRVRR